jgi:hypothetical protein
MPVARLAVHGELIDLGVGFVDANLLDRKNGIDEAAELGAIDGSL